MGPASYSLAMANAARCSAMAWAPTGTGLIPTTSTDVPRSTQSPGCTSPPYQYAGCPLTFVSTPPANGPDLTDASVVSGEAKDTLTPPLPSSTVEVPNHQ